MIETLDDLEYLETLDEADQAELNPSIGAREDFIRMEPTTKVFGQLKIGDLFEIGKEKYRKIPPLMIPAVGERNAAKETTQGWVYFPPETAVLHYGHVDMEVDRVRAERQQTDKR